VTWSRVFPRSIQSAATPAAGQNIASPLPGMITRRPSTNAATYAARYVRLVPNRTPVMPRVSLLGRSLATSSQ
jgi:hypothetical protein